MRSTPFGSPLDPSLFLGRDQAITVTAGRLNDANFSSTSIVGGPRTGKTSLLRYLASENASHHLAVPDTTLRVYVDVELLGSSMTPYDFWISVLRQLRSQSSTLESSLNPVIDKGINHKLTMFNLEDLFEKLRRQGLRIVFFVDNWEYVLRNSAFWPPTSNFLHLVRYFGQGAQQRTIAWVLASQRPLLDLWDATRGASPYYNIFETVPISELEDDDVSKFAHTAFKQAKATLHPELDRFIRQASCGHPYLVNFMITYCLNLQGSTEDVDLDHLLQALSEPNGPLVSLIQQIRGSLSASERALIDKSESSPDALTTNEKNRLATLASYGLLPPRPKL